MTSMRNTWSRCWRCPLETKSLTKRVVIAAIFSSPQYIAILEHLLQGNVTVYKNKPEMKFHWHVERRLVIGWFCWIGLESGRLLPGLLSIQLVSVFVFGNFHRGRLSSIERAATMSITCENRAAFRAAKRDGILRGGNFHRQWTLRKA
jgi:hypothetical protein